MKNLLITLLLFPSILFSQEFKTEEIIVSSGPNFSQGTFVKIDPLIVVETDGTSRELYDKCINWITETYKQPEEVIKGKIEGEYIKINGAASNMIQTSLLGSKIFYDIRYTIELKFKDGRFRMEIINVESYIPSSQYVSGGWYSNPLSFRVINHRGKVDNDGTTNLKVIKTYFDNIIVSLRDYKSSQGILDNEDDW